MTALLSGVRTYGLGLTFAHQDLLQIGGGGDALVSSVLANASTRICFRLGDADARKLADGFSYFEARDLQNLGLGEAICRVERSDNDFNLRTVALPELDREDGRKRALEAIDGSRMRYATPRSELTASEPPIAPPSETVAPAEDCAPVVAPQAVPELGAAPRPAAETGRGGQQHRYLQTLLRRLRKRWPRVVAVPR